MDGCQITFSKKDCKAIIFVFFLFSMYCIIAPSVLRTDEAVTSVFGEGQEAMSASVCASLLYVSEKF